MYNARASALMLTVQSRCSEQRARDIVPQGEAAGDKLRLLFESEATLPTDPDHGPELSGTRQGRAVCRCTVRETPWSTRQPVRAEVTPPYPRSRAVPLGMCSVWQSRAQRGLAMCARAGPAELDVAELREELAVAAQIAAQRAQLLLGEGSPAAATRRATTPNRDSSLLPGAG
jgi:hypothetical protein